MRRLALPTAIMLIGMASCFSSRDFVVESDYSYHGNFRNYKSFTFIQMQKFNQDSLVPDDLIKDAIQFRMSLLGYEEVQKEPNILVAYKMFFSDFVFQGWDQPELEKWLDSEGIVEEEFDPVKYKLKQGTLMILFVDRKQKKAIWQGYNSGLIDPRSLDDERFVKGTVRTIFDKYKVFAEGYYRKG
ncbi:MAG: DUF4136 domain-containing protein [Cyclobacteriaceae bacterium]|nr:DUF4136 domain-containing protein [Cyclobacteriaceae bacterium]